MTNYERMRELAKQIKDAVDEIYREIWRDCGYEVSPMMPLEEIYGTRKNIFATVDLIDELTRALEDEDITGPDITENNRWLEDEIKYLDDAIVYFEELMKIIIYHEELSEAKYELDFKELKRLMDELKDEWSKV